MEACRCPWCGAKANTYTFLVKLDEIPKPIKLFGGYSIIKRRWKELPIQYITECSEFCDGWIDFYNDDCRANSAEESIMKWNKMVLNEISKIRTITLCGSTRFQDEFMRAQEQLTLDGNIVLSPGVFYTSGYSINDATSMLLDEIHRHKIQISDAIYVINKDDYIGESTRSEIEYAKSLGKTVYYMFDHSD